MRTLDLSAQHLTQVEKLYLTSRNLNTIPSADPVSVSRENRRVLKRLLLATQKVRRSPYTLSVHRRSHAQRMQLEEDWANSFMESSDALFRQLSIPAAYHEAQRGWLPPPDEPEEGVFAGKIKESLWKRLYKPKKSDTEFVQEWGGKRSAYARALLEGDLMEGEERWVLRDAAGKPLAIASTFVDAQTGRLGVAVLASQSGHGTRMMIELAKVAKRRGLGIILDAEGESAGFYEKLGMRNKGHGQYELTSAETAAMAVAGGALPPPGTPIKGLSPEENVAARRLTERAAARRAILQAGAKDIRQRLASGVNEESWTKGAMTRYVGMAERTIGESGQISLDHLGLGKTWDAAGTPQMARDITAVRGSKVIQGLYGDHLGSLQKIIVEATDPRNPKTLSEVQAQIRAEWPKLQRYQVERIARTETAAVWTHTSINTYLLNGIDRYESVLAHGPSIGVESEDPCDECAMAAAFVHSIDDDLPPWHPNCRCEAVPVLEDEEGTPWLPPDEPWAGGEPPEGAEMREIPEPGPSAPYAVSPAEGEARALPEPQPSEDVRGALTSWAGAPSDMRIHMNNALEGKPWPGNKGGDTARRQAEALLTELRTNGRVNDVKLYRGVPRETPLSEIPSSWTPNKSIARKFAGKKGVVQEIGKGEGFGIRMADYIRSSAADVREQQWLLIDRAALDARVARMSKRPEYMPEPGTRIEVPAEAEVPPPPAEKVVFIPHMLTQELRGKGTGTLAAKLDRAADMTGPYGTGTAVAGYGGVADVRLATAAEEQEFRTLLSNYVDHHDIRIRGGARRALKKLDELDQPPEAPAPGAWESQPDGKWRNLSTGETADAKDLQTYIEPVLPYEAQSVRLPSAGPVRDMLMKDYNDLHPDLKSVVTETWPNATRSQAGLLRTYLERRLAAETPGMELSAAEEKATRSMLRMVDQLYPVELEEGTAAARAAQSAPYMNVPVSTPTADSFLNVLRTHTEEEDKLVRTSQFEISAYSSSGTKRIYEARENGRWSYVHKDIAVMVETPMSEYSLAGSYEQALEMQRSVNRMIDSALEQTPRGVENLKSVYVLQRPSPLNADFAEATGRKNFEAAATASPDGQITFFSGTKFLTRQDVFDHEVGHIVGLKNGPLLPRVWAGARKADIDVSGKWEEFEMLSGQGRKPLTGDIGITDYGKVNEKEDWAESVMLYLLDRRMGYLGEVRTGDEVQKITFADAYPNRAKLIQRWLYGPGARQPRRIERLLDKLSKNPSVSAYRELQEVGGEIPQAIREAAQHPRIYLDAAPTGGRITIPEVPGSEKIAGEWTKLEDGRWKSGRSGVRRESSTFDVAFAVTMTLLTPGPYLGLGTVADVAAWATFVHQLTGFLPGGAPGVAVSNLQERAAGRTSRALARPPRRTRRR